ncbi:MAG: amidohydrolase family protein [Acidobacteria bacterium]|nr:amidohydrolase family protein [Acidobacteriota bacterium]
MTPSARNRNVPARTRPVRSRKPWFSFEEAIRKMSSMPARRLGLKDRGLIKKGFRADVVLIDRDRVIDNAKFADPQKTAAGIDTAWAGGTPVWENGNTTGKLRGSVLKR